VISIHPRPFIFTNKELEREQHRHYVTGWRKRNVTLAKLVELACTNVWSPIVWHGKVAEKNFSHVEFAVFDIDEGQPMLPVHESLLQKNITHAILPTRSHQKVKSGKPACDRFRLVIPLMRHVTNVYAYKRMMRHMLTYPSLRTADRTIDGARKYLPSTHCEYLHIGVPLVPPLIGAVDHDARIETLERDALRIGFERSQARGVSNGNTSNLTARSKLLLQNGLSAGSRNADLYALYCDLIRHGVSLEQAFVIVESSIGHGGLDVREIGSLHQSAARGIRG
jgi:hypothetical protein